MERLVKLNVSVVGQLKKFGLLGVLWENMAEREGVSVLFLSF